jgi:hypothetical protein
MVRLGTIVRSGLLGAALITTAMVAPIGAAAAHESSTAVHTSSCTYGYSPCIPNKPSDVDCYGGSGNGPRYTKPGVVYHVKRGYDRYRLDADHDGLGCERN